MLNPPPNQDSEYDSIIVGASPLSLIEAFYISRSGRKVLIVERNDWLGGAWAPNDFPDICNLEKAPRILIREAGAYDFMATRLGWSMQPLSPQPQIAWRGLRVPFGSSRAHLLRTAAYYQQTFLPRLFRLFRTFRNLSVGRLVGLIPGLEIPKTDTSQIRSEIGYLTSNFLPRLYALSRRTGKAIWLTAFKPYEPFQFPEGGSREIIDKLSDMLKQTDVEVRLSTTVESLYVDNDSGIAAAKLNGRWTYADEIVVTNHTDVEEVFSPSERVVFPQEKNHNLHLYLIVEDSDTKNPPFVGIEDYPSIIRIGEFPVDSGKPPPNGGTRKLLVVNIREPAPGATPDKQNPEDVMRMLAKIGLVGRNARLNNHYWSDYTTPRDGVATMDDIEKRFGPNLRLFKYSSMSRGISENMARWKSMLDRVRAD